MSAPGPFSGAEGRAFERVLSGVALALLLIGCGIVLRPFVSSLLFATVLWLATAPLHQRVLAWVNGRRSLAALLMTGAAVLLLLFPIVVVGMSVADSAQDLTVATRRWLAGVDDRNRPTLSSLGERTSSLALPASSLAASPGTDDSPYLFVVSDAGGFGRALLAPDGSIASTWQLTDGVGLVRSVATNPSGEVFVVSERPSATGVTSSILRLTPMQ